MKTAFVTGAAGFIGTQIVKELCLKGYTVYALMVDPFNLIGGEQNLIISDKDLNLMNF